MKFGCSLRSPILTVEDLMSWMVYQDLAAALKHCIDSGRQLPNDHLKRPFLDGGYSAEALKSHSIACGSGIPEPVFQLYQALTGIVPGPDYDGPSVAIIDLSHSGWIDPETNSAIGSIGDEYPDWFDAGYYSFGWGCGGDELVWCADPPNRNRGAIMMIDHEFLGPDCPDQPSCITILAHDLAGWLCRWAAYGFEEFGYALGGVKDLPKDQKAAFLADHNRLNPGAHFRDDDGSSN